MHTELFLGTPTDIKIQRCSNRYYKSDSICLELAYIFMYTLNHLLLYHYTANAMEIVLSYIDEERVTKHMYMFSSDKIIIQNVFDPV
jgi:hypothetical protein